AGTQEAGHFARTKVDAERQMHLDFRVNEKLAVEANAAERSEVLGEAEGNFDGRQRGQGEVDSVGIDLLGGAVGDGGSERVAELDEEVFGLVAGDEHGSLLDGGDIAIGRAKADAVG